MADIKMHCLAFCLIAASAHSVFVSSSQDGITFPSVGRSWGWSVGGSVGGSAQFQLDGWHQVTGNVQGKLGTGEASDATGQLTASGGAVGGGISGSYDPTNGWQVNKQGAACTVTLENGVQTVKCDQSTK